MIYRLPVSAGISVSDSNQKSLNLNSLQALPMRECDGAEYNGVISGWSVKEEEADEALTNAVFTDGDELRFKRKSNGTYAPVINGEELDGEIGANYDSWTLKERRFLDAEIIDVNQNVFLRRNIDGDKLIFEYRETGGKKSVECPRRYIFARLAIVKGGAGNIAVSVDDQEIRIYDSSSSSVVTIPIDDEKSKIFADTFCSYKADVYAYNSGGWKYDFIGRGESGESVFHFVLSGNNLVYQTLSGYTVNRILWAFYDAVDFKGYFLAVCVGSQTEEFLVFYKKDGDSVSPTSYGTVSGVIKESLGCWSEFEWFYGSSSESGFPAIKRNYVTKDGVTSDTPSVLGIVELIGETGTNAGYIVHTLNGIPSTIEKDGFYIGGFSGEIATAFPDTGSEVFLYHSSGRVIEFVRRANDFDFLFAGAAEQNRFNAVAASRVKKKMVRFATNRLPSVFDFETKKFIYSNSAYTGAVEAAVSSSAAKEENYKQTAFAALMMNEISNTVCVAKILPVHDDIATGKVKVSVRSPKFYGKKYGISEPVFSFYCGQDIVEDEKSEMNGTRTVNINYLYNFSADSVGYDYSKDGTQFIEGIYNTLLPLPVWAKIREDNPRVADGGNITFFCATNPSAQYRGMGDVGYSNWYVGSSFDSLDSYMFLSGKNFLFKDESISELLLAVNGSISSVSRYIENIKFDYIGQNQSEAFFLSRAEKAFYRYTGYFQLMKAAVFSNLPDLRKGQYVTTIDSLFFFPENDFKNVFVMRGGKVALAALSGEENHCGLIAVQESDERSVKVYRTDANRIAHYADYSFRKDPGYKQQAFSLDTNYIGVPYTELQVKSVALTFYVTLEAADEVTVLFRYKWRYAESAGSEEAEFVIRYDETEVDPAGRRFVRFRFIPRTQKVVDFALGLSLPSLDKDVSLLSVEFAGVEVEADAKEKPLIGELWSR